MPSLSVVIPTYNEQGYLGNLLSDLSVQTVLPDEVIIADCKSDDRTLVVARSFRRKLPVKTVSSAVRSPGAARNAGAKAATSEYLLFIDADMRLPKDMVERFKSSLGQKPADYITSSYLSDGRHVVDRLLVFLITRQMSLRMNVLNKPSGMGGVMGVRAVVHRKIGGFDEPAGLKDDKLYLQKLGRYGATYTYLREVRAITSSRRWAEVPFGEIAKELFRLLPIFKHTGRRKYGHYNK